MPRADRYSGLSTINHWVTALLVIAMLTLGFVGGFAPDEDTEHYVMGVHVALGFFVFLFVLWRVGYRLYEGFPENVGTPFERTAAWWVHRLLLIALVLQVLTGPLYLFTENEGVDVFGWFTVYIPLEGLLGGVHELMEEIHVISGVYVIPILIVVHFLGAVTHYLRDRQHMPADM